MISRQALCEYALNQKDKSITPNDIMRFPSAQPTEASCWGCNCQKMERLKEQKTFSEMVHLHDAETHEERTETHACDLISRQATIDAMENTDWYHLRNGVMVHGANSKEDKPLYKAEDVYKVLNDMPSAQPDIIRCKDCKYSDTDNTLGVMFCWRVSYHEASEDGFCSWAERRTDG